ncbi:hypothetical protein C0995_015903, partial [Termitomyces sp. Mi166
GTFPSIPAAQQLAKSMATIAKPNNCQQEVSATLVSKDVAKTDLKERSLAP